MYEQFYGLSEKPFSLTPDTEFLYRYSGHQEALNVLLVALRNGEGFVRVTGEVGTGKTLLCRQLLKLLEADCAIAYLPNPLLTPLELYQAICHELELSVPADASLQQLCQIIFVELARLHKAQRPLVVLIDEAQAMPHGSLEALRLLSNLETEKDKLLQIVFFAQPEFDQRLAEAKLRQLRQRITFSYQLKSLQEHEVASYLAHRLHVAGYNGPELFTKAAVGVLYKAAGGVPRLLNLLAHKALLAGYGKGVGKIDRGIAVRAVQDTAGLKQPRKAVFSPLSVEFALAMVVAVVTFLTWGLLR